MGGTREVSAADYQRFTVLRAQAQSIALALKDLATRRKAAKDVSEDEGDDELISFDFFI